MLPQLPKKGTRRGHRAQRGQGYIEVIIGLAILLILFHAFASLILAAYDLLGNARTRITARHLAVSRLEEVRNLPYESVGVIGGIPAGAIPQLETLARNGQEYSIRTSVVYIDDPYDNLAPSDTTPSDYKRVRVDVSWTGRFLAGESVTLVSDVALEPMSGGGLLAILVFDANANPVPEAQIRIVNTAVTPTIDLTIQTNDQGRVFLPGAPPCASCYQITVSKDGMSSDRTYATSEVANPAKPHATVTEGFITEISFSIDRTATLQIASTTDRESGFSPLGNKSFNLRGGKTIGTDSLGNPVYKYQEDLTTDGGGSLRLNEMEWDSYQLTLPTGGSWDLAGTNPLRPILVFPQAQLDVAFASAAHASNSLLVTVSDASGSAIASASAQLTGPGGYDQTILSGQAGDPDFGQAFFTLLNATTYTLQVSNIGYQAQSRSIDVSGQTEETVQLNEL